MSVRIVEEELEARLVPVEMSASPSTPKAKAESKVYGDGNRRFKLSMDNLDVPRGEDVEFYINGELLLRIQIDKGKAKLDLRSENGDSIPVVSANDVAYIRYSDNVLVKGRFYAD